MEASKEFLGKTLDAAIAEACAYYGVEREKLEIDIIEDAKTGIFGIVGARKAKVSARVAKLPQFLKGGDTARREGAAAQPKDESRPRQKDKKPVKEQPEQEELPSAPAIPPADAPEAPIAVPADNAEEPGKPDTAPADPDAEGYAEAASQAQENESAPRPQPEAKVQKESKRGRRAVKQAEQEAAPLPPKDDEQEAQESSLPSLPLNELDQEKLTGEVRTVLGKLAAPVLGIESEELEMDIEVSDERVLVALHGDDTGLLIGRDGQNLAAIQYLAARIISRAMEAQVRLSVDAGDYHLRQDSRLQELAVALADRVRQTGKPQTTRPLSAYQRRVIHLALQDDPDVLTRSSGDGALKHVVILRRKD